MIDLETAKTLTNAELIAAVRAAAERERTLQGILAEHLEEIARRRRARRKADAANVVKLEAKKKR